jgi:hypothetical protein
MRESEQNPQEITGGGIFEAMNRRTFVRTVLGVTGAALLAKAAVAMPALDIAESLIDYSEGFGGEHPLLFVGGSDYQYPAITGISRIAEFNRKGRMVRR